MIGSGLGGGGGGGGTQSMDVGITTVRLPALHF